MKKYLTIFLLSFKNEQVYLKDKIISSIFFIMLLLIFKNLWEAIFEQVNATHLHGMTSSQYLWYLVITEVIFLCRKRPHVELSRSIQDGSIAMKLNKPYNYLLFITSEAMGFSFFNAILRLIIGSLSAYLLVGGFRFNLLHFPLILLIIIQTFLLNFLFDLIPALAAFWVEEVKGITLVWEKIRWVLGGFLFPLDIFPEIFQKISQFLPFHAMYYLPAKLFVQFSYHQFLKVVLLNLFWIGIAAIICVIIFKKASQALSINGG